MDDWKWHHLAVTRSGSAWTLYVDGVSEDTATESTPIYTGTNTKIGIYDLLGDFNGYIDDVRIYSKALNAAEIRQVYDEGNKKYKHANQYYGAGIVHRARVDGAVGAVTSITANLILEDGAEAGAGEYGNQITVYFDIMGGGNLNSVVPRLADDQYFFVMQSWHTDGTLRWYGIPPWQTSEDCTCTAP
jgi:hypothetical protein